MSRCTVQRKILKVISHELYGNYRNNIALLQVHKEFVFSVRVQSIELYTGKLNILDDVIVMGWGGRYPDVISPILRYSKLFVQSNDDYCGFHSIPAFCYIGVFPLLAYNKSSVSYVISI